MWVANEFLDSFLQGLVMVEEESNCGKICSWFSSLGIEIFGFVFCLVLYLSKILFEMYEKSFYADIIFVAFSFYHLYLY